MTYAVSRLARGAGWRRGGVKRFTHGAVAASAVLAVGLLAFAAPASAQDPKAAPKADAAKKAAPGEKSVNWLKLCEKQSPPAKKEGEKPTPVEVCSTRMDVMDKLGTYIFGVRVMKVEGQPEDVLQLVLPHVPIQIVARPKPEEKDAKPKVVGQRASTFIITAGARMQIDDDKEPTKLQFSTCDAEACIATVKITPELMKKLRTGKKLRALAIDAAGITVPYPPTAPVGLEGFAETYEGKPLDPETYKARLQEFSKVIQANRQVALEQQRAAHEKQKAEEMKNLPPPPGAAAPAAKK